VYTLIAPVNHFDVSGPVFKRDKRFRAQKTLDGFRLVLPQKPPFPEFSLVYIVAIKHMINESAMSLEFFLAISHAASILGFVWKLGQTPAEPAVAFAFVLLMVVE